MGFSGGGYILREIGNFPEELDDSDLLEYSSQISGTFDLSILMKLSNLTTLQVPGIPILLNVH